MGPPKMECPGLVTAQDCEMEDGNGHRLKLGPGPGPWEEDYFAVKLFDETRAPESLSMPHL